MQNFSSQGCQINKGFFSPRISEGLHILLIFWLSVSALKMGELHHWRFTAFSQDLIVIYVKEADV